MTCCIGKARIYFREPINHWLVYELNGSFGSVTALEPLTTEWAPDPPGQVPDAVYTVRVNATGDWGLPWEGSALFTNKIGPISWWVEQSNPYEATAVVVDRNGTQGKNLYNGSYPLTIYSTSAEITRVGDASPPTYTFKVIGTETGTVYREIGGLEERPTVISNICLMGEERYIDQLLPDQSPGGPVESSCFVLDVDGDNWRVDLVTTYKNIDNKALRPAQRRNVLYLTGLPGCPPEYRVECCGIDQCEPEKCPPDTDCSLDCGDFVCCYKDGKVIKTIQK